MRKTDRGQGLKTVVGLVIFAGISAWFIVGGMRERERISSTNSVQLDNPPQEAASAPAADASAAK